MTRQLRHAVALVAAPSDAASEPLLVIEQAFRSRGWIVVGCAAPEASLQAWLETNCGVLPPHLLGKVAGRADAVLAIPPAPKR